MALTRRECLTRMLGAVVAAAVAPLIDLTDATPAFWNQAPLAKLIPFRITFPDGLTYTFNGTVVAERLLDDGFELTIHPVGGSMISQEITYPIKYKDEPEDDDTGGIFGEPLPSPHGAATVLTRAGQTFEIQDIDGPQLHRVPFDTFDTDEPATIPGLRRTGEITFTLNFLPAVTP